MPIYSHLDASLPQPTRLSPDGVEHLHQFEGFREEAYLCPAGVWTIGFGNTRWPSGEPVRAGDRVTRAQGTELARTILQDFEEAVSDAVDVPLTQNQFDALVLFTYNVGVGALNTSTLLRKLNAGKYDEAADQFLRWNKGGGRVLRGLTRRRQAERALFKE